MSKIKLKFEVEFWYDPELNNFEFISSKQVGNKQAVREVSSTSEARIVLEENRLVFNQLALEALKVNSEDRVVIQYDKDEEGKMRPVIAKEETLGIKGGNKLSKSNTVSCRGKAHDKLAEYGGVFSLVEKDTGIYFMYGDTEPKPYKEVTDDNIQIDENDELGDLDLELTQDALEINFSDIL